MLFIPDFSQMVVFLIENPGGIKPPSLLQEGARKPQRGGESPKDEGAPFLFAPLKLKSQRPYQGYEGGGS